MDIRLQYIKKASSTPALAKQEALFVNPSRITIGREAGCNLALDCKEKTISRQHARIDKRGDHYTITDMSVNGTYINKNTKPIGNGQSTPLLNNDMIRLGDYWVRFQLGHSANNQSIRNKSISNKSASKKPTSKKTVSNNQTVRHIRQPTANNTKTSLATKDSLPLTLGSANKDFKPPTPLIPQNWNMSLKKKDDTLDSAPPSTEKKQAPIHFSNQNSELTENLVKGLGISINECELSPEKMLALGRCLRAAIAGMIKQRDDLEKIKKTLCYDEKKLLKELKYSSLADFSTADDFLKTIVSGSQKTHTEFPLEVLKCQKEIMEDQVAMYNSFNKAVDSFREELSPFSIEKLYQKKGTNIAEKLVPSIGKWDIYKKEWGKQCISFKKAVKNHFQETIKTLHQKRIKERQVVKKKK